jgi:sterol desaturase/sphingolipid hydroxylase (fatty acid hydroxylase superfamily)
MPVFFDFNYYRKLYGHYKSEDYCSNMDAVSSVSSGMVNSLKDVLGLSITLISYDWIASKIALFELEATVLTYLIGCAIDFMGIGGHRLSHQINFLWNKHAFITAVRI